MNFYHISSHRQDFPRQSVIYEANKNEKHDTSKTEKYCCNEYSGERIPLRTRPKAQRFEHRSGQESVSLNIANLDGMSTESK